jgi:hypothetical protein
MKCEMSRDMWDFPTWPASGTADVKGAPREQDGCAFRNGSEAGVGRRIMEGVEDTEFDPEEVLGFMTSEEAAEFLGDSYSSFREIAPPARARDHAGALAWAVP